MSTDYVSLLIKIGPKEFPDKDVRAVYRTGSQVYGTATPTSDEDFVVVLDSLKAKQDLLFRTNINVVVHTAKSFQEALDKHNIFALECFFLPPEHRLKTPKVPFKFKCNRKKLVDAAISVSNTDYEKAKKIFETKPLIAKKKLFHSLRIPIFAYEILQNGHLVNYGAANYLWNEINDPTSRDLTWNVFNAAYGDLRQQLCQDLQ